MPLVEPVSVDPEVTVVVEPDPLVPADVVELEELVVPAVPPDVPPVLVVDTPVAGVEWKATLLSHAHELPLLRRAGSRVRQEHGNRYARAAFLKVFV